jgi:hypothetical protein
MEFKFDIGDRVRLTNAFFKGELAPGATGTVLNRGVLFPGRPEYCIKLDTDGSDIEAWWVFEVDLEAEDV